MPGPDLVIKCWLCDARFKATDRQVLDDPSDDNPPAENCCPRCGAHDCVDAEEIDPVAERRGSPL